VSRFIAFFMNMDRFMPTYIREIINLRILKRPHVNEYNHL
jgi:hypothetical protein